MSDQDIRERMSKFDPKTHTKEEFTALIAERIKTFCGSACLDVGDWGGPDQLTFTWVKQHGLNQDIIFDLTCLACEVCKTPLEVKNARRYILLIAEEMFEGTMAHGDCEAFWQEQEGMIQP